MSRGLGFLLSKLAVWAQFCLYYAQFGQGWHYVSGALEVPMNLQNMLRLKI